MAVIGLNQQAPQSSWWSGTPAFTQQVPNFSQSQQGIFDQSLQQGYQGLQGLANQPFQGQQLLSQILGILGGERPNIDAIINQETKRFNQETIPTLASRFASMGSGEGGLRSSAFTGSLQSAGQNLAEQLAGLKAKYGLEQRGQDQNLLQVLLGALQNQQGQQGNILSNLFQGGSQRPYDYVGYGAQPGFKQTAGEIAGNVANVAGNAAMGYAAGGVPGAVIAGGGALYNKIKGNKSQPVTPQLA